jgi:ADP-heptose:LPS heptosyltransferase
MNNAKVFSVKKIAVLRSNALGDFIVTLPAIDALKKAYPKAELVLLANNWHKEYFHDRPSSLDRVIVIPAIRKISVPFDFKENKEKIKEFIEEMKKERFDLIIHFMGNGIAANSLINKFDAGLTVGSVGPRAEKINRYIIFHYYQREVLRYLEIVGLVGATNEDLEPNITVTPKDLAEIVNLLNLNEKYIVLHTGANDLRRFWPPEKFAQLADKLIFKGYKIILTGIKLEEDQIMNTYNLIQHKENVINLMDKLTLYGLTGLLSRSSLFISTDTGPLHLARAVGCKTIGLYWLPNVINWGPMTNRLHRTVISYELHCPVCGSIPVNPWPFEPQNKGCKHLVSFIKDISVKEVYSNIKDLISI